MALDQVDEAVDAEVGESHDALVFEPLDPDEAVLGLISMATSKRKSTSSPRSLATRSMVLARETLLTCMGQAARAVAARGCGRQFQGNSSSSRCAGWPAIRARTSASHACGSTPFILAVTMSPYMSAARRPPRSDPQNSHDFRPSATQRNPRSAALLKGMVSATLLFRLAFMA